MVINTCKCGKPLKNRNGKRCTVCVRYYTDIIRTDVGKAMSENELEALVLKRTRAFRKRLVNMANGID